MAGSGEALPRVADAGLKLPPSIGIANATRQRDHAVVRSRSVVFGSWV